MHHHPSLAPARLKSAALSSCSLTGAQPMPWTPQQSPQPNCCPAQAHHYARASATRMHPLGHTPATPANPETGPEATVHGVAAFTVSKHTHEETLTGRPGWSAIPHVVPLGHLFLSAQLMCAHRRLAMLPPRPTNSGFTQSECFGHASCSAMRQIFTSNHPKPQIRRPTLAMA